MKNSLILLFSVITLTVNAQIKTLTVGEIAPAISLKNVDNKQVSFEDYPNAKGFIIVFTCNTCPVAQAYEQRIIELSKNMTPLGYPVIAINPNDPAVAAGDSFVKMQDRSKAKKYPFPYLFDAGQTITNLYGATRTPHLFLAQKTDKGLVIKYTGAIDDDQGDSNPSRNKFVEDAVKALNANQTPAITSTKAIGCMVRRAI